MNVGKLVGIAAGIIIVVAGILAMVYTIKGSGNVITAERSVGSFTGVSMSGVGTINITEGTNQTVKITTDDNLLPYLKTEVKNDILYIWMSRLIYGSSGIIFDVEVPTLTEMKLAGTGHVNGSNVIHGENIIIKIGGSGDINMDIEATNVSNIITGSGSMNLNVVADTISSYVSGSGSIYLQGEAKSENIKISGSGNILANELMVDDAEVAISGSGRVEVNAGEKLDVNISGSGSLSYRGSPQLNARTTGSGKITKKDEE